MPKHSLSLAGHRTSISLEPVFWRAFQSAAEERGLSVAALAARIDAERTGNQGVEGSLSGRIRVFVMQEALARIAQLERAVADAKAGRK